MTHTDPRLLDPSNAWEIQRYMMDRGLLAPDGVPIRWRARATAT